MGSTDRIHRSPVAGSVDIRKVVLGIPNIIIKICNNVIAQIGRAGGHSADWFVSSILTRYY